MASVGAASRWCLIVVLACQCFWLSLSTDGTVSDDVQLPQRWDNQSLSSDWGLPDATAFVGRLFQYRLSRDQSNNNNNDYVETYKVSLADGGPIPSWLRVDERAHHLEGVPDDLALGLDLYFQVVATRIYRNDTEYQYVDVFRVEVRDEDIYIVDPSLSLQPEPVQTSMVQCPRNAAVTTSAIIIDAELENLSSIRKVSLLKKAAAYTNLPPEIFRLKRRDSNPLLNTASLVTGPGDISEPHHSGVLIQWDVGCGNVLAEHMSVLELLDKTSSNGELREAVGYPIIGWHITNNRPYVLNRAKRKPVLQATPLSSTVPPYGKPTATHNILESSMVTGTGRPTKATDSLPGATGKPKPGQTANVKPTAVVGPDKSTTAENLSGNNAAHTSPSTKFATFFSIMELVTTAVTLIARYNVTDEPETRSSSSITSDTTKNKQTTTKMGITHQQVTSIAQALDTSPESTTMTLSSTHEDETENPFAAVTEFSSFTTSTLEDTTTLTPTTDELEEIEIEIDEYDDQTTARRRVSRRPHRPAQTIPPILEEFNFAPVLRNEIGRLDVVVGNALLFRIPGNTFRDHEDGGTRHLRLLLMTTDGITLPPTSWVMFNESTQTLYGVPLAEHIGRHRYLLAAMDKEGKIANNTFEIVVMKNLFEATSNEFQVTFDIDYWKFYLDTQMRMQLISKIADAFGDRDWNKITVLSIEKGSVKYVWTNKTLPAEPCPRNDLAIILWHIIMPDNKVNKEFVKAMRPFRVLNAKFTPRGACVGYLPVVNGETAVAEDYEEDKMDVVDKKQRETADNRVILFVIIPLVVVALLLLVLLIYCLLRNKRNRKKVKDDEDPVRKGVPVIFADELDEKKERPQINPILGDSERQTASPPPDYPGSRTSTLRSNYKQRITSDTGFGRTSPMSVSQYSTLRSQREMPARNSPAACLSSL